MAIGFNIQFRINEKVDSRVIRLTDTSSNGGGFTFGKGNFSIAFPDGTSINHTDFSSPDITSIGGYYDFQASTDIYNNVLTGQYVVTYVVLDANNVAQTPLVRTITDFNWIKPEAVIQNKSDVFIPEVQFYDATNYVNIGNFVGTVSRTFSVPFPTTSEVSGQSVTTTGQTLTPVVSGKYYEGLYNISLDVTVNYTNSIHSWLSLYYTDLTQKTIDIRQVPTQTQIVTKMNAFRADIDAYKEKNDTQFERLSEEYDIAVALYSHLIARFETNTLDGSQPLLEELLSILQPYDGIYSYKATNLTPFDLGIQQTGYFILSDGTSIDTFYLQGTLLFSSANAALGISVSDNSITFTPNFGTTANTFAQGNDIRFLPAGGTTGQILAKIDNTSYNTTWIDNFTSQIKHEVKLGESCAVGTVVYVGSDLNSSTNMTVYKASNDSELKSSKTMGVTITAGAANDFVYIATEGLLSGVNTSGAVKGDPIWLGQNGTLLFGIANKPVAPLNMVYVGVVTRVNSNNGEIFVKIQNGFEIEELHNVLITSVVNGNILYYDSATSLWKNGALAASAPLSYNASTRTFSISQASSSTNGYLSSTDWNTFNSKQDALTNPITGLGTINYLPKFTGTTALGNSQIFDNGSEIGIGTTSTSNTLLRIVKSIISSASNFNVVQVDTTVATGSTATNIRNFRSAFNNESSVTTSTFIHYQAIQGSVSTSSSSLQYQYGFHVGSGFNYAGLGNYGFVGQVSASANNYNLYMASTANNYLAGNLLIGTTVDAGFKIDVSGTARITGQLRLDSTITNGTFTYTLPSATGTIALISNLSDYTPTARTLTINGVTYDLSLNRTWSVGTVTSVAALTLGTTGTDLSSTVATGTTTPVITLNVPTASATNRGALSSADWSTFNSKEPAIAAGTTAQYWRGDKSWQTLNTTAVTEGTNLYFTSARVRSTDLTGLNVTGGSISTTDTIIAAFGKIQNQLNTLSGSVIYQGVWNASTNTPTLASGVGTKGYYYKVSVAGSTTIDGVSEWKVGDWLIYNGTTWDKVDNTDSVSSVNGYTGAVSLTTSDITEGTRLYYTDARVRLALSVSAPLGYNNTTGAFTISQATTSTNGYLSSADWNTFNNKQDTLINPITGTGANNYLPKFTGATTLGNSTIQDSGTLITLGANLTTANSIGIGTTSLSDTSFSVSKNISGATTAYGIVQNGVVQSGVTSNAYGILNSFSTQASTFTLTNYRHFYANQSVIGAGSTVTNQYGYYVESNLTGATNNYGFHGNIASGTGRWNLYMAGTAQNYLAGSLLIGTTTDAGYKLDVTGTARITSTLSVGATRTVTINPSSVGSIRIAGSAGGWVTGLFFDGSAATQYGGFAAFGGTDSLTYWYIGDSQTANGIRVYPTTNNVLMSNNVGVGSISSSASLNVTKNITGTTSSFGVVQNGVVQSDVTTAAHGFYNSINTQATAFTLSVYRHFYADNGTIGAGSVVNNQYGFVVNDLTGATSNYGFYGALSSGTSKWNLYMGGTAPNYLAGNLGIGTTVLTSTTLAISKGVTGATNATAIDVSGSILSDVTGIGFGVTTFLNTQQATFTLGSYRHFHANQGSIRTGSTVTEQMGFYVNVNLSGATNNYGFYGALSSGTGRWNLYMQGTADNYLAGNTGIGSTPLSNTVLRINKNLTGNVSQYGALFQGTAQSDVTTQVFGVMSSFGTQAATFTLSSLYYYYVSQGTFGAGSTVSNQYGVHVDSSLTGATNNYAFFSNVANGTGRWNIYMNGTANNYLGGNLGLGSTSLSIVNINLARPITGGTTAYGMLAQGQVQNDVSTSSVNFFSQSNVATNSAALPNYTHYQAEQGTLTGSVTNQYGFRVTSVFTGATNNYGFHGGIASGTGRWNLYMAGTADNYLAGNLSIGTTTATYKLNWAAGSNFGFLDNAVGGAVVGSTGFLDLYSGATPAGRLRVTTGGNVLIGTTTDSGYKLDVNGTGRVQGLLTLTNSINNNFLSFNYGGTVWFNKITNANTSTYVIGNDSGGGINAITISQSGVTFFTSSITAESLNLSALNTAPASSTATGTLGQIRIDSSYIYVCVNTNTWKRATLSTW